jgi:hypothetical protein
MMKKILLALTILFSFGAIADQKISQMTLGTASGLAANDSVPYYDSAGPGNKQLKFSDFVNIPALVATYAPLASPTFTGTVTAPTFVGAFTGAASLDVLKSGDTMTGALVNSKAGAASTPAIKVTGAPFTGGSSTTTKPQVLIEDASTSNGWQTTGTYFGINAASAFTGILASFDLNGSNLWYVDYQGLMAGQSLNFSTGVFSSNFKFGGGSPAVGSIFSSSSVFGDGAWESPSTAWNAGAPSPGTAGHYLRSNGTAWTGATIPAGDLPTVTITGDVAGTGSGGTIAVTAPTVNSNVGSFTAANITVNAKGQVTAASNGASAPTYIIPTRQTLTSGTTYIPTFIFIVTSANASLGASYTNNSFTFVVSNTISGATVLTAVGSGSPTSSGTLTKSTGTGDATITFASVSNTPLYIDVTVVGGGAGGGGGAAGTAGNTSTFGTSPQISCSGGSAGGAPTTSNNYVVGGAAGTCSLNGIGPGALFTGSSGGSPACVGTATFGCLGGAGGATFLGGAGQGVSSAGGNGGSAAANTGSGGAGGASTASATSGGSGGGPGGWATARISPVASSYSYAIAGSASGGAASGLHAGGSGAGGIIFVEEKWQ